MPIGGGAFVDPFLSTTSCQWPCSGDQTFPGGGVPAGAGRGPLGRADRGSNGTPPEDLTGDPSSCQWPCSGDQTRRRTGDAALGPRDTATTTATAPAPITRAR